MTETAGRRLAALPLPATPMPSRHAHRAALRRSKEPGCIPPANLVDMPAVPSGCGWRNPMRGYDFDRSEWELYRVHAAGSDRLALVKAVPGGYVVTRPGTKSETHDAVEALAWAAQAALAS